MLARTYKTAEELCLPQGQYDALIKVKEALESGVFVHKPLPEIVVHGAEGTRPPVTDSPAFSMQTFKCGTAGCISGWMYVVEHGGEIDAGSMMRMVDNCGSLERTPGLDELFYARELGFCVEGLGFITPDMAARAIDNYLQTGWPDWPEATGLPKKLVLRRR